MKQRIFHIIILLLLFPGACLSQYNGKNFSLSAGFNYITTSKIYLQPNSADPFFRSTHDNLEDIYSVSFEFRYTVLDELIIGIGAEYLSKTHTNRNFFLAGNRIEIEDGYSVIPIEISGYYLVPFSTENFKFFMGGGAGIYLGRHIRRFGNAEFNPDGNEIGYGIHVAIGMEYLLNEYFSVRGQMRFRDPEFNMKSRYSSKEVNYKGNIYPLPAGSISSKVNIDGITFNIGVSFNF